jgi:hypothetical protein
MVTEEIEGKPWLAGRKKIEGRRELSIRNIWSEL